MINLLKSVWEIITGFFMATKPFWWSDFWWMNGIKVLAIIICAVLDISSRGEKKLLRFGLGIYAFLSFLSLFIREEAV